jgi:hypothetical protein
MVIPPRILCTVTPSFLHHDTCLIIGPATDDIGAVGKILLRNAGFGKKERAGLYIITESPSRTVGIREGKNLVKASG